MRTTTAILFGLASLCNTALAQDETCTSDAQAAYIPLIGSADAAEYCFDKVLDRSDDSSSISESTITATPTADSLRFRRRDKGRGKTESYSSRHGGDDEDKEVKSLLKSLSKGPFSIASTFCSCNFPSGTPTAIATPTPTLGCGFFNSTLNGTVTVTETLFLNATATGDDSSITAIATLGTTTSEDDSSSSTTTSV